jgi:hypothetical protein
MPEQYQLPRTIFMATISSLGARGSLVVKALGYKVEGRRFKFT